MTTRWRRDRSASAQVDQLRAAVRQAELDLSYTKIYAPEAGRINIPIGILATLMILAFVRDPTYIRGARPGRLDALGLGLLVVWIATLQIVLDKGQEADWFSASWVRWFAVVGALGFVGFVVRELRTEAPLVRPITC